MRNINRALLALIVAATPLSGALGGCSDSSDEENTADELSEDCSLNSDCGDPLICAFSRCHKQCAADRDCPTGQRCVTGEEDDAEEAQKPGVCQLPVEKKCKEDRDCNGGQYCGPDQECRDGCNDDSDCNLIKDYVVCTPSHVCAKEDEVGSNGDLPPAGGGSEGGAGGATGAGGGSGGASEPTPGDAGAGGEPDMGSGGAGGASGGTGGKTGGTGGKTGEGGAPSGDDCSLPDADNNDRDSATPYEFDTEVKGCLQSTMDVDFFEFTTPEEPVQGGQLLVRTTNVGMDGNYYLTVYSGTDNAKIREYYGAQGANGAIWFPAAPGQLFRASVTPYSVIPPEYTFSAEYIPYEDAYEPNDSREDAVPIELDTPIEAYLFKGYSSSAAPDNDNDWYEVTLAAGSVTATLDQPESVASYIILVDSTGNTVAQQYGAAGTDITLERNNLAGPAKYYFNVQHYTGANVNGSGTTPPEFDQQKYVFEVTQD